MIVMLLWTQLNIINMNDKKTKYVQVRRKGGVSLLVAVTDTVAYAR